MSQVTTKQNQGNRPAPPAHAPNLNKGKAPAQQTTNDSAVKNTTAASNGSSAPNGAPAGGAPNSKRIIARDLNTFTLRFAQITEKTRNMNDLDKFMNLDLWRKEYFVTLLAEMNRQSDPNKYSSAARMLLENPMDIDSYDDSTIYMCLNKALREKKEVAEKKEEEFKQRASVPPQAKFRNVSQDEEDPSSVVDDASFTRFFYAMMGRAKRDDLARVYSRMSVTEHGLLAESIAMGLGAMDEEKMSAANANAKMSLLETGNKTLRMSKGDQGANIEGKPAYYRAAARFMGQLSGGRDFKLDTPRVEGAFKMVKQMNVMAGQEEVKEAQAGGVTASAGIKNTFEGADEKEQMEFHEDVTFAEKLAAMNVKDMPTFAKFYEKMHKENSKNVAAFQALDDQKEKPLFVWALSNPSKVAKWIGPLRYSDRHDKAARKQAKQDFVEGNLQTKPEDYPRAARTLLSKEGRYYKTKVAYNQPIVRDAMHFVRAAMMKRVDSLRKAHEELAKTTDGAVSGKTKWSATNSIDVERGKMREYAERVTDMNSFAQFLEMGLDKSGAKEQFGEYSALSERAKILFVRGLANRKLTEGTTDRSRIGILQKAGNFFSPNSVKDDAGRQALINEFNGKFAGPVTSTGAKPAAQEFTIAPTDPKYAAINLVSKDSQKLLAGKGMHIDVDMVKRGFQLIKHADQEMRKADAADQNGYAQQAAILRQNNRINATAMGSSDLKYQAAVGIESDFTEQAKSISDKAGFEAFFQSLMEADENMERYTTYASYSENMQNLFVRALANRDVIDRDRDQVSFIRYTVFGGRYSYHDRKGREDLKNEAKAVGAGKLTGGVQTIQAPTGNEYKAAAFSIMSRETRIGNALTRKFGSKRGDDDLLERAMKLVRVAGEKAEEAADVEREKMLTDAGQGDTKLARHATEEIKQLADESADVKTFEAFLAKAANVKYVKKYTALSASERKLFIKAIAHRSTLDKVSGDIHANEVGRYMLKRNSVEGNADADLMPIEYQQAAYALLGAKGRALGGHRFLWIRGSAVNKSLMDDAFKLVKAADTMKDEVGAAKTRTDELKEMGVSKLSSRAKAETRLRADAMVDARDFKTFFEEQMKKQGREHYYHTFASLRADGQKAYMGGLAYGTLDTFRKKTQKEQLEQIKKESDSKLARGAAYRVIEHRKTDAKALKLAEELGQAGMSFSSDREKEDYENSEEYKSLDMDEATEFEHVGGTTTTSVKASYGRRKVGETARNFGQWAKDTHTKHKMAVANILENQTAGSTKNKVTKFFIKTLNPFLWGDLKSRDAHQDTLDAAKIKENEKGFMEYLHTHAKADGYVSIYNAVSKLKKDQMALFIKALNDRKVLDASNEEGETMDVQNEAGRTDLIKKYIAGTLTEPAAEDYRAAAVALTTHKVLAESNVNEALNKTQKRSTVVDWDLVQDALALVQFSAEDERSMANRKKDDGKDDGELSNMRSFKNDEVSLVDKALDLKGHYDAVMENKAEAMESFNILKSTANFTDPSKMEKNSALKNLISLKDVHQAPGKVLEEVGVENIGDLFGKMDSIAGIKNTISKIAESEVVSSISGGALTVTNLLTSTKSLIQGGIDLGMESYEMYKIRSQSDEFSKEMLLSDKIDIVQRALSDAFKMTKAMQGKNVNEKVFNLMTTICGIIGTGLALGGVPAPIVTFVKNVSALLLKGTRFLVDKLIDVFSGDRVKTMLGVKERTHAYNQKVKAFNNRPGLSKKQKRDLMTEGQMQNQLLRQSGFKTMEGARNYVCLKTANCMVYAYEGSSKPVEKTAAANLFASLKVPFTNGLGAPKAKDVAMKLKGAK